MRNVECTDRYSIVHTSTSTSWQMRWLDASCMIHCISMLLHRITMILIQRDKSNSTHVAAYVFMLYCLTYWCDYPTSNKIMLLAYLLSVRIINYVYVYVYVMIVCHDMMLCCVLLKWHRWGVGFIERDIFYGVWW